MVHPGREKAMAWYVCHGVTLEVEQEGADAEPVLERFLRGLWWARTVQGGSAARLRLRICQHQGGWRVPAAAQPVWEVDGFQGYALAEDLYVTDGQSLLYLQPRQGVGQAQLAPDFFAKPPQVQRSFWMVGLLKLLRVLGLHIVHAAAVVHQEGGGLLITGPSGSGKSTLSISLIRQGWRYLSDDTVLLGQQPDGVVARTWRKEISIDATATAAYADLPLGAEAAGAAEKRKRRVYIEAAYPGQQVAGCLPRVLLFAQVVPQAASTVMPLARARALQQLLAQSGPPLFDRSSMAPHVAVLTRLLHQAPPYVLCAGRDVYQAPGRVEQLLTTVMGAA